MAETTCYVVLEPEWGRQSWNRDQLRGMAATRLTKGRPNKPAGVVIKLKVRVPDAVFKPFAPEVTITVPEDAIHYEPTVEVVYPDTPDDAA